MFETIKELIASIKDIAERQRRIETRLCVLCEHVGVTINSKPTKEIK